MDLRETALLDTSSTLGHELPEDTLQFAGVDSSLAPSYFDSEFQDEDSEVHVVDVNSPVEHEDTYECVLDTAV